MEQSNTSYKSDANPASSAVSDSLRTQEGISMSGTVLEFQSIYDTFRPKILRYLTQLVGEDEAEDLTQTVMVKVSQGLLNFRGDCSLSTWIYRIATNTALDKLRSPAMKLTARQLHLTEVQWEIAPIHESRLRLGYLLKARRSAGRWWSSDKADWKSVVVTWSGRRL
jgi:DNA-directed RNA polymerase specialized sigma24 family protein